MFKFSREELKLILVSDFDISYLKRNKYIDKSFYLEPLYEDMLTRMVLFIHGHFAKRKKSQDLYEFVGLLKEDFAKDFKEIGYLKNDLFYINFFESVRDISVFDGKI
jgi:hypothetical protein